MSELAGLAGSKMSTGTLRPRQTIERPHHPGEKIVKGVGTQDNRLFPDPTHADRGGVRLLVSLLERLNLVGLCCSRISQSLQVYHP